MNKDKILESINLSISEIILWNTKFVTPTDIDYIDQKIVMLELLRTEITNKDFNEINIRVLRAFKDICADVARNWEDYAFHDPIFYVYDEFCENIPGFISLEILGSSFGKQDPI